MVDHPKPKKPERAKRTPKHPPKRRAPEPHPEGRQKPHHDAHAFDPQDQCEERGRGRDLGPRAS